MPKCVTYVPGIKRYLCVRKLSVRAEPQRTIPALAHSAWAFTGSKQCFSRPRLTLLGPPFTYWNMLGQGNELIGYASDDR